MVAEAFIQDGAKQMDGANLRPSFPERISRRLGLMQPGLSPPLKLRGIGCEALGPVLLPIHGHGSILLPVSPFVHSKRRLPSGRLYAFRLALRRE